MNTERYVFVLNCKTFLKSISCYNVPPLHLSHPFLNCKKHTDNTVFSSYIGKSPHILNVFSEFEHNLHCVKVEVSFFLFHLQKLGNYLVEHQYNLSTASLTLFCLQICKALAYLEGLNMVHR